MYVGVEAGWWSAGGDVKGDCVAAEWASVADAFHRLMSCCPIQVATGETTPLPHC